MREFKFRAWDYEKREFVGTIGYIGLLNKEGKISFILSKILVFQQYTGLKDRNGKEIYEGDIIEIDDTELVIEWENSICGFIAGEKHNSALCKNRKDDTKVIGNIYENSNLLK